MQFIEADFKQQLEKKGFEVLSYSKKNDDAIDVAVKKLHRINTQHDGELYIPVPTTLQVKLDTSNIIQSLKENVINPNVIVDAEQFVKNLIDNGQLSGITGQSSSYPTHKIEINAEGQRVIRRNRFSLM